jgi:hypothetical protein
MPHIKFLLFLHSTHAIVKIMHGEIQQQKNPRPVGERPPPRYYTKKEILSLLTDKTLEPRSTPGLASRNLGGATHRYLQAGTTAPHEAWQGVLFTPSLKFTSTGIQTQD